MPENGGRPERGRILRIATSTLSATLRVHSVSARGLLSLPPVLQTHILSTAQVITAGLSNTILTFPCSLSTHDPSAAPVSKPRQTLQGHEANVTSLDSILIDSAESGPKRMLVSSSWDGSARTWSRYDVDEEWKAESQMWHECAVWDAKFLPAADGEGEVQVLTCQSTA